MVCRHTAREGVKERERECLNCDGDREEWGRLQSARQRDRRRYKGGEKETFASLLAPTGLCSVESPMLSYPAVSLVPTVNVTITDGTGSG